MLMVIPQRVIPDPDRSPAFHPAAIFRDACNVSRVIKFPRKSRNGILSGIVSCIVMRCIIFLFKPNLSSGIEFLPRKKGGGKKKEGYPPPSEKDVSRALGCMRAGNRINISLKCILRSVARETHGYRGYLYARVSSTGSSCCFVKVVTPAPGSV